MLTHLKKNLKNEDGSEVIQTVLLIPFFLIMIVILLYLSLLPYSRAQMNYIAAQGADMAAVYGGNQGPYAPTNVLDAGGVDQFLMANPETNAAAQAAFSKDWEIQCRAAGGAHNTVNVGDPVTCKVRYFFKPPVNPSVIPGGSQFIKWSVVQKTAFSEVGELK